MNIVISGSSSGIGKGLAEYFAQKKHNVCITYYGSKEKGENVLSGVQKLHADGNPYYLGWMF